MRVRIPAESWMNESKAPPRVSIVLCTYYGTAHLEKQLQSIFAQTLQPFEAVICDDNSKDETLSILESFRDQASFRVRIVVSDHNFGSTRNFDQSPELASGEFLALRPQDDIWFPQKLAKLVQVLKEFLHVGGVFSYATLIDAEGLPIPPHGAAGGEKTLWNLHGFNRRKQMRFVSGGAIDLLFQHDIVTGAALLVRVSLRSAWHPIPESWGHDGWITWMLAVQYSTRGRPGTSCRLPDSRATAVGGWRTLSRAAAETHSGDRTGTFRKSRRSVFGSAPKNRGDRRSESRVASFDRPKDSPPAPEIAAAA